MKQQDMDAALNRTSLKAFPFTRCELAGLIHIWLTELINSPSASWFQRQVLRTVRGYVQNYIADCK